MNAFAAAFLGSLFAIVTVNVVRGMIVRWMIRRAARDAGGKLPSGAFSAVPPPPAMGTTMATVCKGCDLMVSFPVPAGVKIHDAAFVYLTVRSWEYLGNENGWRCPACAKSVGGSCVPKIGTTKTTEVA